MRPGFDIGSAEPETGRNVCSLEPQGYFLILDFYSFVNWMRLMAELKPND